MSLNKHSEAMGFGRLFAALASPLAVRTLVAVSTLGIACMSGSAQSLTLDDFTTGQYVVTINNVNTKDLHYAPLPPGSPLGAARGTLFEAGINPYKQPSRFQTEKLTGLPTPGICIVDVGFGVDAYLDMGYGFTLQGQQAPLNLDLGTYSALQLNFAGISTSGYLLLDITLFPASGSYYNFEVLLPPSAVPYVETIPISSFADFNGVHLTQSIASNISSIDIQLESDYSGASFGLTSIGAVK